MALWNFLITDEDGEVFGTNDDSKIELLARHYVVLDVNNGTYRSSPRETVKSLPDYFLEDLDKDDGF